jgi:DNA gyrase subunit A
MGLMYIRSKINTIKMSTDGNKIVQINIEDEMKTAYIDYSMSVIVSRALPDVRDGLKPVHRRVLYGMYELGVTHNKAYKKSARIVGEVLGKYHPHGDTSVYDAMVRMAQDWSLRYPLVEGQGNFGSVDGDSPAAMRYTEARMRKITDEMLADIEKNTVDFTNNFDDTLKEPSVMPTKIPNLIINGASGIAVGMATNMMPHNLTETLNAIIDYVDNRDITIEEIGKHIKGPDFPTGAILYGVDGVRNYFNTGRGKVVLRSKNTIENTGTKEQIIATEVPFQVNRDNMIAKTADLVNDKVIEGISDIRNESSDRGGTRIVYDLKRDAVGNVVLNKLYKYTLLQTSYGVNNICLVKGRPRLLNIKELIENFVEFRHEVVVRRTQFDLDEALKRIHILEGYIIALNNLDAVIKLIRESKNPEVAREGLISSFELSEIQARAILELRLARLTGMEIDKIREEHAAVMMEIANFREILANEPLRYQIIKDELIEIRKKYGDERRTAIEYRTDEIRMEDLIDDETVVISISHLGYIKRTSLTEYRQQSRGGKGSKGSETRDEDFIEHIFVATNHNTLLLFTDEGRCFWLKVYEVPEGTKTSKGRALQNIINIPPTDKVRAYINIKDITDTEALNNTFVVLCTKKGVIKKTTLEAYSRPRQGGITAINVREGDTLLDAVLTNGNCEMVMATKYGKTIRFPEQKVRPVGRTATGVTGVDLDEDVLTDNEVIGMICFDKAIPNRSILVVSEKGYGKRSDIDEYRITNRGGKGVKTLNITEKTGQLIAIKNVSDDDDLMIMNKSGITIRLAAANLRVMGRATQGVTLIKIKDSDSIASVTAIYDVASLDIDDDETKPTEGIENETLETNSPKIETEIENENENENQNDDNAPTTDEPIEE